MIDSNKKDFITDNTKDLCAQELLNDLLESKINYSTANYQIDMTNSTSLPTSPSKDNIGTISGNSLSNSADNIPREPMVSEIEFMSTNDDNSGNASLKPQPSFNSNVLMINQKRKKSNIFSNSNSYRNKVITFMKIFADTEVINDTLLSDFSCALVKNSHSILLQGRLYITDSWICFYSKIMSFENKIVLPISGIINVSKEKTARVIPNAIQITTEAGKYFFTSFGSREKTFNVIMKLWQNVKDKKSLSSYEEKCIIQNCYGNEVDIFVNDDSEQLQNVTKAIFNKDAIDNGEACIPTFVVGDESDTDTEPSLYSSSINQTDEIAEKVESTNRFRKKSHQSNAKLESKRQDELSATSPVILQSLNTSNNLQKSISRVYSHPNLGKRIHPQSCADHEHYQKFYLDEEIDMHIDRLFNCLFTHSSFFKRFCEYRKTFDVIQASWPDEFCVNGLKERIIYYTLTLKAKIGPKISASEEKQILHNNSQAGLFYMLDTEVRNSGFPLADCFHSVNRYCLIHISGSKSRLKVSSQIVYDKSIFFASKSLIESTAKSGMTDYFNDLGNALKHEARTPVHQFNVNHSLRQTPTLSDNKRSSILQPLDNQHKANLSNIDSIHSSFPDNFGASSAGRMRADKAWFMVIVLSLILCLCLSFLYSRFRQLEEITNAQIHRQHQPKFESTFDWKERLQHQHQHQLDELSQWKLLVDNSIDLIDQMKSVLVIIRSNLDKLSQEIKSNPVPFGGKEKALKFT